MADVDTTADSIRRHMQEIRRDLRNNVSEVVSGANELLDWKSYVRRHPWLMVGSAAVLGFMLVPRRNRELDAAAATQESLNNLANQFHAQSAPRPAPSLLGIVAPMIGGILIRAGTAYGTNLIGQMLDSVVQNSKTEGSDTSKEGRDSIPAGYSGNGSRKGNI